MTEEPTAEDLTEEEGPKWSEDQEIEARAFGWKPADEWQGDRPPKGIIESPDEYMEWVNKSTPFRLLKERYDGLEAKLAKNEDTVSRIDKVYAAQIEKQRALYESRLEEISKQKLAAVEIGDIEAYQDAEKQEKTIRQQVPEEPVQKQEVPPEITAALDSWRVENLWFGQDQEKTKAASLAWSEAEGMGIRTPEAILKFVDRAIAEKFPAEKPQRQQAAVTEGLSMNGGAVEAFSKLPKNAKAAFKRMVEQKLFEDTKEDRAEYANEFNAAS